jgi:hypothetical protein
MPYISQKRRVEIGEGIFDEVSKVIEDSGTDCSSGDLNYMITRILNIYLFKKELKYDNINSVVGVLENVKLELNRRVTGPYEDKKIEENGDVYYSILV